MASTLNLFRNGNCWLHRLVRSSLSNYERGPGDRRRVHWKCDCVEEQSNRKMCGSSHRALYITCHRSVERKIRRIRVRYCESHLMRHKMSDGGRGRALLEVKVRKSSQKWSVRRSAVRSIAWLGLCGFIDGRGARIGAQLHNKFFAIIAIAHILSCKLESAFL